MTQLTTRLPMQGLQAGFHQFSVAEYHQLIDMGLIAEDDDLELIEGWLVHKMSRNPPHDSLLHQVLERLAEELPSDWQMRIQSAITLPDSEPEPDLAAVRKHPDRYRNRHPTAADAGLLIEVSDSSLDGDREDKGRIYARAGIERYWIVNVPDRHIEVYEGPSGPAADPSYASRRDYRPGDDIPFVLAGIAIALIPVLDLLG